MKADHKANPDTKRPSIEEQLLALWKGGADQETMRQRIMNIEAKKQGPKR